MIRRPKPERFRLRRTMMFMNAQKPGLIKDAYIYGCDSIMLDLEDAVVVVAPLVPWSIAGGVPLASIAAPTASIFFACYLYLLPLWRLSGSLLRRSAHK